MYLEDHDAAFSHSPRTGGTSIEIAFGVGLHTLDEPDEHGDMRSPRAFRDKHDKPVTIREEHGDDVWIFTFVRNSWDRLVSIWSFETWLRLRIEGETYPEFDEWVKPRVLHGDLAWNRYTEQTSWVEGANFVGRFEELESDFRKVAAHLSLDLELPHINNMRRRKHYSTYYTPETREIVREACKAEIELFDFKFEEGVT